MKKSALTIFIMCLSLQLAAEQHDKDEALNYIPLLGYEHLALGSQSVHSPSGGLIVKNKDTTILGLYSYHNFLDDFQIESPDEYHSIDFLYNTKKDRHEFLSVFKSSSDKPVSGGLHTFQSAAVYGYEFIANSSFSLTAGGGLAVSDFGIDLADGTPWPLLPVPFVRAKYKSSAFNIVLDFITGPNISTTVAPKSKVRLETELRIDRFRDSRDLLFDCALAYRFFPADHEYGDFAGISAGLKSDELNFDVSNNDPTAVQYYAAYGKLDITLLQLTAGYTFAGIERHGEEEVLSLGDGFFINLQALYQF